MKAQKKLKMKKSVSMLSKAALMIGSALLLSTGISYGNTECADMVITGDLDVFDEEASEYLDRNAQGSPQFPSYNGFITTDDEGNPSKIHNFGLFNNVGRVTITNIGQDGAGKTTLNPWINENYTQNFSVTEDSTYSVVNGYAAWNDLTELDGSQNVELAAVPMTGGFWIHPEGEDTDTPIQLYADLTELQSGTATLGSSAVKAGATLTFSEEDGENENLTLESYNCLSSQGENFYSQSAGTIGIGTPFVYSQGGSSKITMEGQSNVGLDVLAQTNHAWYNTADKLEAPGYAEESEMQKPCGFTITKKSYKDFCETYGAKYAVKGLDYINYLISQVTESELANTETIDANGKVRAEQPDEIDLSGVCAKIEWYGYANKTVGDLRKQEKMGLDALKKKFDLSGGEVDFKSLWTKAGADVDKQMVVKNLILSIIKDKKISELSEFYNEDTKDAFRTFFSLTKDGTNSADDVAIGKFEEYSNLADFLDDSGGLNGPTDTIPAHLERMAIANGIGAMGGVSDGTALTFNDWKLNNVLAQGNGNKSTVMATATIAEDAAWEGGVPTSGKHQANAAAYSTGVGVTYLNGDLNGTASDPSSMTGWSYLSSEIGKGVNLKTTASVNDNYTVWYDAANYKDPEKNYAANDPLKAYVSAAGIGSSYLKNVTVNDWDVTILNKDDVVDTKAVYNYHPDGKESGTAVTTINLIPVEVLSTGIGFSNVADGSDSGGTTISKGTNTGMDVTLLSEVNSKAELNFEFNQDITTENRHLDDFIKYSNVASTAIGAGYVGVNNTFGDLNVYLNYAEDKVEGDNVYKELLRKDNANEVNILSSVSNSLEESVSWENVGVATGIGVGIANGTIGNITVTSKYKGWAEGDKDSEGNKIRIVPQKLSMAVTGGRVATGIGVGFMGDDAAWVTEGEDPNLTTITRWTVENVSLKQAEGGKAFVEASQYATGIGVGEGGKGLPNLTVTVDDVVGQLDVVATGNYSPSSTGSGQDSGASFFGQGSDTSGTGDVDINVNFNTENGALRAMSYAPFTSASSVGSYAAIAKSFNTGNFNFHVNENGTETGTLIAVAYNEQHMGALDTNALTSSGISSEATTNNIRLNNVDVHSVAFMPNVTKGQKASSYARGISLDNSGATQNTVVLNKSNIASFAEVLQGQIAEGGYQGVKSRGIFSSAAFSELDLIDSSVFSTAISKETARSFAIWSKNSLGNVNIKVSPGEASYFSSVGVHDGVSATPCQSYAFKAGGDSNIYFSSPMSEDPATSEGKVGADIYVSALQLLPEQAENADNIGMLFSDPEGGAINLHVGAWYERIATTGEIVSAYSYEKGTPENPDMFYNGPGCLHLSGALGNVGYMNIYNGWEVEISQDSSGTPLDTVNVSDGLISVLSELQNKDHTVRSDILEHHPVMTEHNKKTMESDGQMLKEYAPALENLSYNGKLAAKKFIFGTRALEDGGAAGPTKVTYSGRIILGGNGLPKNSPSESAQLFAVASGDNTTGFGLDEVTGGLSFNTGVSVNAHVIQTPLAEGISQITNLIGITTTTGQNTSTDSLKVDPGNSVTQGGDTYYMLAGSASKDLVLKYDEYTNVGNLYFLVKENAEDPKENGFVLATAEVDGDKLVRVADESNLVTLAVEPNPAAVKYADGEAGIAVTDTNRTINDTVMSIAKLNTKEDPFLMVLGGRSKLDDTSSYGYKGTLYGVVGGLDKMFDFGDGLLMKVGALVGYTHNKLDMNGAAVIKDKVWKQEMWTGGVYGHLEGYAFGEKFYNINGMLSYGYLTNRLTRNDVTGDYSAKFHGSAFNVNIEGEMNLCEVCSFYVGPWASIAYNRINQKAYSESGSGHPYSLGKVHFDFLDTVLGAKASRVFASDDGTRDLVLYGHAGWLCQPVRNASKTNATIANVIAAPTSPHFDFKQKNAFVCDLGLKKFLDENIDISGKVQFVVNGKYHDVVGNLALGYSF